MTDTRRPDPCHYDRALAIRVTQRHRDDCRTNTCEGCAPCTAPHCSVCGREHADNDHPQTCPKCEGKVARDLRDLRDDYALLAREALAAGADGHLVAAAPIPGGNAAVMIGPTVRLPLLRTSRTFRDDHLRGDPLPPLAVLAQWEDVYRAFLGHDHAAKPTERAKWGQLVAVPRRATIGGAVGYLIDQLPRIAQRTDGPDFLAFTRQVRSLRASCDRALHDEREPEEGVECFECGDKLVRRLRQPMPCKHMTPAREWWLTLRSYPELQPTVADAQAARKSCGRCSQGGVDDPSAGQSWECPGCRKEYDPGEYATAVRRSLIEENNMGWCTLVAAADAAQDITKRPITPATIRTWIARGDDVAVCCLWEPGRSFGVQLVYWPDVIERATTTRRPGRRPLSA